VDSGTTSGWYISRPIWEFDFDGNPRLYDGNGDGIIRIDMGVYESSNQPPVADADGPYTIAEGSSLTLNASGSSDPDNDTLEYKWDLDYDGLYDDETGVYPTIDWSTLVLMGINDNGTYSIGLEVSDGKETDTDVTTVTVNNVAPSITALIVLPIVPVAVGNPVALTCDFTDPGTADTHTCQINWGDSTTSGDVTGYSVSESNSYTAAGVYSIEITITDDDGDSDTGICQQYIVVYDPDAGFVTGGGWINSPEGAYAADPTLTGKANFGFVAKYMRGATTPSGNTEFHFKAGNLHFHSSSYQWLIVAGARAQFKGTGTINSNGNYGFMLTAIDAKLTPSTDIDMFRIKIWDIDNSDALVYDNMLDAAEDADPTTKIGGGNIVIHKG
jgi:hypothetical protein